VCDVCLQRCELRCEGVDLRVCSIELGDSLCELVQQLFVRLCELDIRLRELGVRVCVHTVGLREVRVGVCECVEFCAQCGDCVCFHGLHTSLL
jgi:hypothetical protein